MSDKVFKSTATNFRQACKAEGIVTEAAHGWFGQLDMEFIAEEECYQMAYTTNETIEDLNMFLDHSEVAPTGRG